jgi:serine/threonine protein kinase
VLNSLYELSGDPRNALAQLLERFGADGEVELLQEVERLLADVSVQPDVIESIERAYEFPEVLIPPTIRGPLGLSLFLDLVTRASLHERPQEEFFVQASAFLRDDAVKASLRALYRLDEDALLRDCKLDDATLHEIGTTSVILECEKSNPKELVALKCVLPRHFTVRAITEGARQYGERHRAILSIAPTVFGSNERAVMMEFVEGRTLAQHFEADQLADPRPGDPRGEQLARTRALGGTQIEFIRQLGRTLCDVLEALHAKDQCHLDLSPRNIILVRERYPLEVRLIDFGRNFAIADGVSSSLALARASVYVEPHMITHERRGDWRSDCYSLGIILLEAAALRPLHRETIAAELWRLWTGEHAWDGAPGLARIIEDLIDAEPEQRLVFVGAEAPERARRPLGGKAHPRPRIPA